jgi:hypothetical protein
MAKFDRALIKHKTNSKVDKAYMNAKSIQFKEDFSLQTTLWIPKAQANKPCPNPVLVVNVGDDGLRINASSVDEIKEALYNIIAFIDQSEYEVEKTLIVERKKWIEHQQNYLKSLNASEEEIRAFPKVIPINKAANQ